MPAITLKRIAGVLFGTQENIFAGVFFLIFRKKYRSKFGTFLIPRSWERAHFYARFLNNSYESEERALVAKYLNADDHVLELGACVGVVSCLTAKQIGSGRHCVVEANPNLIPYLYQNRSLNQCAFTILHGALTEANAVEFFINKNMVGGSSHRSTDDSCNVTGLPLAGVIERYGPFNTLIMDIEGGEQDILESYQEILKSFQKLIIEFHPAILGQEAVTNLRQQLSSSGFNCTESHGDVDFWAREN